METSIEFKLDMNRWEPQTDETHCYWDVMGILGIYGTCGGYANLANIWREWMFKRKGVLIKKKFPRYIDLPLGRKHFQPFSSIL